MLLKESAYLMNSSSSQQPYLFNNKSKAQRKELGQFFTDSKTAEYMASMLHSVGDTPCVQVLDAGAGEGILAEFVALRCFQLGHRRVHAVLYEIDNDILPTLEITIERLRSTFLTSGGTLTYEIKNEDFILSRPDKLERKFHISIINPPYFKYNSKNSKYSGSTADLFKGNPNIYASFMAVVTSCLVQNGQMVAIVPRSFTNGLYFKGFRHYLRDVASLERMHIFRSRNRVLKKWACCKKMLFLNL
ncbi:MAG: hypothetical protein D3924_03900 [Candidatus Electrothrix sp. AR4]|nr:hypothetical protein [Candidatus Electrothrix sp. AR4]